MGSMLSGCETIDTKSTIKVIIRPTVKKAVLVRK